MSSAEEKSDESQAKLEADKSSNEDKSLADDDRGCIGGSGGAGEEDNDQLVIDEADGEKSDGESDEKEFEPTLDMMMNDFDDEQTMEEEEANEDQDNEEDELAALEQEQDMPIEELLKMYGAVPAAAQEPETEGNPKAADDDIMVEKKTIEAAATEEAVEAEMIVPSTSHDKNELESGDAENGAELSIAGKRRGSTTPPPPIKKSKSELARFYEAAVEGRALRSQGSGLAPDEVGIEEEEDDEGLEDSDNENRDYSWKKTIMIGPSYQASVPSDLAAYDDTLPYENEDKLLWNPGQLSLQEVEDYLAKSYEAVLTGGVGSIPLGAHVRDDEQALYLLLQCGYNSEEALRRRRMNAVPTAETMSLWSEEECRAFELGLRLYGKDFHMIQSQKVKTRSVGELVQFYYLWKKTERHDVFANNTRLEKKKYTLHPGTTDYMDRFIDEQDPSRDRSSSPNFYSLMFGSSDGRKGLSLYPGAKSQIQLGGSDSNGAATETNIASSQPVTSSSPIRASSDAAESLAMPTAALTVTAPPGAPANGRVTVMEKNSDTPSSQAHPAAAPASTTQ